MTNDLVATSVLSGNRNFEGRVSPGRARQLSRLAAAGRRLCARGHGDEGPDVDPLGKDRDGNDVFLRDIWPTNREVKDMVEGALSPAKCSSSRYGQVFDGDERWQGDRRHRRPRLPVLRRPPPTCRTRPISRA